jgi:hypothetical protein
MSHTDRGNYSGVYSSDSRVEKIEEVETPAGRFAAYKIINLNNNAPWATCWFAPAVGWTVKCEGVTAALNFALTSYHLE